MQIFLKGLALRKIKRGLGFDLAQQIVPKDFKPQCFSDLDLVKPGFGEDPALLGRATL